jgi:hypothetical protein
MKLETPFVALALLHAPLLAVQDPAPPTPASELKAFAPLVGSWQGTGTVRGAAGADAAANWTATIDAEWILDGHALREVTAVNFGAEMPPMTMDTLYFYDRETKSLAQYSASSMGGLEVADLVHSPEAGTIIYASTMLYEGSAIVDRVIMRFVGEGMNLVIERAENGAKAYDHVSGTFTRRKEGARAIGAAAQKAAALAKPLSALAPMVGTFDLAGSWIPAPGVPAMKITGVDTITPILGGQALTIDTVGTAEGSSDQYKGYSIIAWNEAEGAFHQAWVDNMGMGGHCPLYKIADGQFVSVRSGHENGTPYTDRTELRCTDGKLTSMRSDRMTGALPAAVMFEAKYTAKK